MMHAQATKRRQGLLLLGHGSLVDADSAKVVHLHAQRLRASFDEVQVGFWKEPPYLHEALLTMQADDITISPIFLSQGYFTTKILPRELGLERPADIMWRGSRRLRYLSPVGQDASIHEAILERALVALAHNQDKRCALLIAAHGTERNPSSAKAAIDAAAQVVRVLPEHTDATVPVAMGFIDQAPTLDEALNELIDAPSRPEHVIVVPFFISEGMHVKQDLPQLLQSAAVTIEHTEAMGTTSRFTQLIEQMARAPWPALARAHEPTQASAALPLPERLGQLRIEQRADHISLHHHEDLAVASAPITSACALRARTRYDEHGAYRPLPYTLDLPRGWWAKATDLVMARAMIEAIYPMILHYARWDLEAASPVVTLEQTLARQSGRAASLSELPKARAMQVAREACQACALTPQWADEPAHPTPAAPGCPQACPVALERLQAL